MTMTIDELAFQCDLELKSEHKGGQYVGTPKGTMILTHRETGIQVIVPSSSGYRSQHRCRNAMLEAMAYLITSVA